MTNINFHHFILQFSTPEELSFNEGDIFTLGVTINYSPYFWVNSMVKPDTTIGLRFEVQLGQFEYLCSAIGNDHVYVAQVVIGKPTDQRVTATSCGLEITDWDTNDNSPIEVKLAGK